MSFIDDLNKLYDEAIDYYKQGRLHEATSVLKNILRKHSISGTNNKEVVAICYKAHFQLGLIYKTQNKSKEAIEEFDKIPTEDVNCIPGRFEIIDLYDKLYMDTGSEYYHKQAVSYCGFIILENPDNFEAHFKLAKIIRFSENTEKTYKEFKKAISLKPDSLDARLEFIDFLYDDEEFTEIENQCNDILLKDTNNAEAHYWLSKALLEKNQIETSFDEIKKALKINNNQASYHDQYGSILKKNNQIKEAILEFKKANNLEPKSYRYPNNLIETMVENEQYDDAINECKNVTKRIPDYIYYHKRCAEILEKLGRLDEAVIEYLEAQKKRPTDSKEIKERLRLIKEKLRHTSKLTKTYSFSDEENEFLTNYQLDKKLKTIIGDTELGLREFIIFIFEQEYGRDWATVLGNNGSIKKIIDSCIDKQQKEKSSLGKYSESILDYSYPSELFDLIFIEWNKFQPIFSNGLKERSEKKYWRKHADMIAKIRTPTAHNRKVHLEKHEKIMAIALCEELLAIIRKIRIE